MNNFVFITPEEYVKKDSAMPLTKAQKIARRVAHKCSECGSEDEWKLAETGMCFTCTTGESDASDDHELRIAK